MTFINYNTRKKLKIFEGITGPIYHSEQATFGHFTLEEGVLAPAHVHPHEQWTHVIDGEIEFTLGDETQILTAGMSAYIPSNVVHSVKAIKQTKIIDCFIPVREDFKELEKNTL